MRVEFFLINVAAGTVMSRSVFEERQEGLVDNLLKVGSFIKRRGQWVTAEQLSVDGMEELGREAADWLAQFKQRDQEHIALNLPADVLADRYINLHLNVYNPTAWV